MFLSEYFAVGEKAVFVTLIAKAKSNEPNLKIYRNLFYRHRRTDFMQKRQQEFHGKVTHLDADTMKIKISVRWRRTGTIRLPNIRIPTIN
jgi:hypothetical protein